MEHNALCTLLKQKKLIAILRGINEEDIIPLVEALHEGGIDFAEVTFDASSPEKWDVTAREITLLQKHFGEEMHIGAGTVLTPEQLLIAQKAGAEFYVAPNTDAEIIRNAKKMGMVAIPGAFTPSEIAEAYKAGADFIKLFPADKLGPDYVHALQAPYPHIPLLVFNGIKEDNIGYYMKSGACGAGISSALVRKDYIREKDWVEITYIAKKFVSLVEKY